MEQIRIGLLIPHTDTTLEYDLKRELPSHCSIHTERMWLDNVTIESEKKMIEKELPRALTYLKAIDVDVVIFGCTSAGSIYGLEGDRRVKMKMSDELNCPSISAYSAVHHALNERDAHEVAVVTPYIESVTKSVVKGLENENFTIPFFKGMGMENDIDIGKTKPEEILDFIHMHHENIENVDTLFISCTNLRALECQRTIESEYHVNVITSNGAIIREIKRLFNFD